MFEKEDCPETSRTNPVKAIRMKCMDCSGYQRVEVEKCPCQDCALWPFRMGKNPFRTKKSREWTDEERAALAERLKRGRGKMLVGV